MPDFYAKLDVNFQDNERVLGVPVEAELLFVRSIAFAKRIESDGKVGLAQYRRHLSDKLVDPDRAVAELEDVGLWTPVEGGWLIRDWDDHNPTRDEVRERRARDAERKRKSRGTSADVTADVRADTDGRPETSGGQEEVSARREEKSRERDADTLTQLAIDYPRLDLTAERVKFEHWAKATGKRYADPDAGFRLWLDRARPTAEVVEIGQPARPHCDECGGCGQILDEDAVAHPCPACGLAVAQ